MSHNTDPSKRRLESHLGQKGIDKCSFELHRVHNNMRDIGSVRWSLPVLPDRPDDYVQVRASPSYERVGKES